MRVFRRVLLIAALLLAGSIAAFLAWPEKPLPRGARADRIVVAKADRRLSLMRAGEILKSYRISLGAVPAGHKQQQGDERTPEGQYLIDWRNPHSKFHLALHISYPNVEDRKNASRRGVAPGGGIMIHGLANDFGWVGRFHRLLNWTDGCIAVTNAEIEEIWGAVGDGTPVEIRP